MLKSTAALFLTLATTSVFAADTVDFVTNPGTMRPNSTFELRFSSPIVAAEQVNKPASPPPLVIQPLLPGEFMWMSQSSGILRPSVPPALSSTYVFTLAPGLKTADGKPFTGTLRRVIDTPPFQVIGSYPGRGSSNASALAGFRLSFNAPVDATKAASFITYTDRSGLIIPAKTMQTDPNRIAGHAHPATPPNQFHVAPARPLPPSAEWKLVVDTGLPAVEPGLKTLTPWSVSVGTVRPFVVSAVRAENTLSEKRRISLVLSKMPAKEVSGKSFERWVRIEPRPENLTASIESAHWDGTSTVTLKGDFMLHQDYRVTVCAGLPAVEGFILPADHDAVVKFDAIEPRLGFEDGSASQVSSGNRKVQLLSINVPRVRVTAKAFTPDTAADAARAYRRYFDYDRLKPDEMHKIDIGSLPGRTVFQQDYPLPARVDEPDQLALDWDRILGPGATGIALITAEALDVANGEEMPGSQTLIQLTDLGVVWKDSNSETFLFVFSLKSGQPIAGASLQLLDEKNAIIGEATTDASGTARLPNSKQAAYLLARSGSDLNLIRFEYRDHISHHRFRIAWDGGEEDLDDEFAGQNGSRRHVLMFTDRPVYKPGETCHLKGIVRDGRPGFPALPDGQQATLETIDSRGKSFFAQKVTLSPAGSFTADVKLPSGPLGDYIWRLRFAGDKPAADEDRRRTHHDHTFAVQEYQPNAFEILIGQPKTEPGTSDTVFAMRAKYYMGKPLSKAEVNWSLEAADAGFQPDGFDRFTFCDGARWELSEAPAFSENGTLEVAEDGTASIHSRIPFNEKSPQPRQAGIRCEVTDVNQQTVSEAKAVTLHSSDFYVGIAALPEVIREGEALPLQLIAVQSDGTPRMEPVEAQVRLLRVDWQTNRVQGAGYSESYQSKATLTPCAQVALRTQPVKKTAAGWVLANPEVRDMSLTVPQPGQYQIEATTKDAGGRPILTSRMLYVHGRAATVWNYRNPFQIEIVPDKTEYASGETATLLVKAPISGTALVTVEREHVRRSFLARLEGNAPAVRVQLEPDDAPNVYVSVLILRGTADSPKKFKMPEYRVGYCALPVQRRDSRLVVSAQPSRSAYRPGEPVELRVEARTATSKPVAGAEVTLYAVDEGILSLMGYETPDPYSFFNRRRALGVSTGLTLPDLKSEDPAHRVFGNKGYLIGDGGESMSLRKNFLACAYWNASLRTDEAGQVTARFTAPDSLTRYRIIAVVLTETDQFGSASGAFEVNKPVMIEPVPPRFGNVGDRIIARSVIHNTTALEGDAEVRLVLDSTARSSEPLTARVHLKPGTSVPVDFPVEFVSVGEAVWKFTVDFASGGTSYRDAVESRLKVAFPAPLLRQIVQGRAAAGGTEMLGAIDPALLNGHGMVRVSLSNSRVVELRESLSQLLHYPYGCVEQTTSSTLPWLSLRGLGGALPELMRPESEVKRSIQHGVDRLLSMQTESGGLAYWPGGSEPLLYASAWGG
ncbi:MAG: MG2 domain-containing protein, partial [Chthoniobacteraceae bacterium]